jgi:farnesyl-diphosphate farnesyltransferase
MVLNALKHAEDCLFYMAGMKDQSVFNFVAIPQTMAIATLELVFRNPAMFDRNIKMTRGVACELMIEATQNLFTVCEVFRKHVRRIHKKNDPRDPSYIAISTQCGRIEQFIETLYPRQTAKKAYTEYHMKGRKELGMDPGEGAILVLVMVLSIGLVCALMVSPVPRSLASFMLLYRDCPSCPMAGWVSWLPINPLSASCWLTL